MPYINPVIGGLLIGLSAVLMMYAIGRICGISGIVKGAIQNLFLDPLKHVKEHAWRWMFLIGLIIGPLITHQVPSAKAPSPIAASWGLVIVSGLLVGAGTTLGSGCTSGHGVCGIARLSTRSLVATMIFMLSGFITVYVVRHLL